MHAFGILVFMRGRAIPLLVLLAVLVNAAAARADEIRLKDGTKINGTIVGFENDSFRVETSYGFALIRKDKVADINVSAAKNEPEPKAKPSTPPPPLPAAKPAPLPAVAKESPPATNTPAAVNVSASERPTVAANTSPPSAQTEPVPVKASAPPPASPPPPQPPGIRPDSQGNLHLN